jgi:hypothetical protein
MVVVAVVSDRLWLEVLWRQDWLQCSDGANEAATRARLTKNRGLPSPMRSTLTSLLVIMAAAVGAKRFSSSVHWQARVCLRRSGGIVAGIVKKTPNLDGIDPLIRAQTAIQKIL